MVIFYSDIEIIEYIYGNDLYPEQGEKIPMSLLSGTSEISVRRSKFKNSLALWTN